MRSSNSIRTAAVILSAIALLSFLARTFVDYRFVYAELGFDTNALGFMILVHIAYVGGCIWALVAAWRGRRALYVLLAYNIILLVWASYTLTALCPSPCRTGWPVGEITIWSNVLIGIPAVLLVALSLFRRRSAAAP